MFRNSAWPQPRRRILPKWSGLFAPAMARPARNACGMRYSEARVAMYRKRLMGNTPPRQSLNGVTPLVRNEAVGALFVPLGMAAASLSMAAASLGMAAALVSGQRVFVRGGMTLLHDMASAIPRFVPVEVVVRLVSA